MSRPQAILDTDPRTETDHLGYLRIQAPDGRVDVIMVTDGASYELYPDRPKYSKGPVWHIDIEPDNTVLATPGIQLRGVVIVSPSIDIKDRYHTANQIRFDLVEAFGE